MDSRATTFLLLGLAIGLVVGAIPAVLAFLASARSRERAAGLEATLAAERAGAADKLRLLDDARARLGDAFKAISADALRASSASFLELARAALSREHEAARGDLDRRQVAIGELVGPVRESLGKLDLQLREIEKARQGAYGALNEQLRAVGEAQGLLRAEAQNLVKALRADGWPAVVSGAGPSVLAFCDGPDCTSGSVAQLLDRAPAGWTARHLAVEQHGALVG